MPIRCDRSSSLLASQFNDTFNAAGFNKDSTNAGSTQGGVAVANTAGTLNEFEGRGGNDIIVGNGNTRVSYLHATAGVNVTFTSWTGNSLGASGQALGDVSVGQDTFSGVNSARGSYFADELYGSNNLTGIEVFEGRGGNDFIDGRGGFDRASYQFDDNGDNSGITISLAVGMVTGGAYTGIDTLRSIESINGTEFADSYNAAGFTGIGALVPSANSGDSGAGGTSSDFNEFEGRGGNDTVTGNNNTRVTYSNALAGVTIDLSTGQSFGSTQANLLLGPAVDPANVGTDNFASGVAHVRGSEFGDIITGNGNSNQLEGQGGADILNGGGGNDRLTGGTGSRSLRLFAGRWQ